MWWSGCRRLRKPTWDEMLTRKCGGTGSGMLGGSVSRGHRRVPMIRYGIHCQGWISPAIVSIFSRRDWWMQWKRLLPWGRLLRYRTVADGGDGQEFPVSRFLLTGKEFPVYVEDIRTVLSTSDCHTKRARICLRAFFQANAGGARSHTSAHSRRRRRVFT